MESCAHCGVCRSWNPAEACFAESIGITIQQSERCFETYTMHECAKHVKVFRTLLQHRIELFPADATASSPAFTQVSVPQSVGNRRKGGRSHNSPLQRTSRLRFHASDIRVVAVLNFRGRACDGRAAPQWQTGEHLQKCVGCVLLHPCR